MIANILRQPLVHFLLIGGLVFGLYNTANRPSPETASGRIEISLDTANRLAATFERTWRRKPTVDELSAIMDQYVKEEVLVREARIYSMDQDDPVIRQRLSQKMQFLLESSVAEPEPGPGELEEFFRANSQSYVMPAQAAVEQVYLGEQFEENGLKPLRAALAQGGDYKSLGSRSLLPASVPLSTKRGLDNVFGDGFWDKLADARLNEWTGPIRSGYGFHLVRVVERVEESLPSFEDVKARVLEEWQRKKIAALQEVEFERLRSRYTVTLPERTALEQLVQ